MEDPEKCRSLVCDASGIIIAEMVYRCMICHYVTDNIQEAKNHYQSLHMHDEDDEEADSQHGAHGGVGHHHNNHNSHHPSIKQVPSSTESMLSKDKAHVNRSLQQQRKSINNSLTNNNNNNNNNNPLVPDISLYEDESPKSYRATPDNSALNLSSSAGGAVAANNGSSTKSGYVTCAVCNVTRYYSCVQRRYGQFTCVTCYRYFRTFLLKPKRYACPSLGECALNVRTRCRACWIKACISVFSVDARRQQVIQANLPVKRAGSIKIPPDGIPQNLSIGNYSASENGDHDAADSPLSLPVKVEMGDDGMDMLEPEVSLTEDGDADGEPMEDSSQLDQDNGQDGVDHTPSPPLSELEEHVQDGEINSSLIQQSPVGNQELNKLIVTGKKVWSCGKCATCTAEDCGTCIYCLDRPKFGGPFIKKQRCVKRRCLMKIKSKQTLLKKEKP